MAHPPHRGQCSDPMTGANNTSTVVSLILSWIALAESLAAAVAMSTERYIADKSLSLHTTVLETSRTVAGSTGVIGCGMLCRAGKKKYSSEHGGRRRGEITGHSHFLSLRRMGRLSRRRNVIRGIFTSGEDTIMYCGLR